MNKKEILAEIKRIVEKDEGRIPGFEYFSSETGIRKSDWYPHLWLRWSDAILEAGYQPNVLCTAYESNYLIEKYIELIRKLGHFPIDGELRIKRKTDKNFPSHKAFSQLGSKQERLQKIVEYCKEKNDYDDIISFCLKVTKTSREKSEEENFASKNLGYVYLIKHGSRNEYKIGRTNNIIRREGEIRLELPEKIKPIHYIETDDPAGIENYWHTRFQNKRKSGEWFSLTADDVRAFKRWRKIY